MPYLGLGAMSRNSLWRLLGSLVLIFAWTVNANAANLCVKVGGNNSTVKASINYIAGNEAGSTCWAAIGRAAWGSTNRSSPDTSQAAAAGDIVYVFGGDYDSSAVISDRFGVLYDPANAGSSGNPIRFVSVGTVTVTCPGCLSPVLGSQSTNYVEWYADITLGHSWTILACAEDPSGGDCPASGVARATPDTGPVLLSGTGVKVEGLRISAFNDINYSLNENWPAIRVEGCTDCLIRNNYIRDFAYASGNSHAVCVQVYNTTNSIIEHNDCADGGAFLTFKDNSGHNLEGNIVRFNKASNITECIGYSLQGAGTEDRNYVYQNLLINCSFGTFITSAQNDWIVNNTIVGSGAGLFVNGGSPNVNGVRWWGNVVTGMANGGIYSNTSMPSASVLSAQHNIYQHSGNFYNSDGETDRATLAAFVAVHTTQEVESPAGIVQDPLYANAAGGDYRLCTGSGVPHVSCSGASPALALSVDILDLDDDGSTVDTIPAGAYVTGTEVLGLNGAAQGGGGGGGNGSRGKGRMRMRGKEPTLPELLVELGQRVPVPSAVFHTP